MSWEDPHAWRNSYDAWKLASPADDYAYDDEPPEPERLFVYQPRHTRLREAENRALASRAALIAKALDLASSYRKLIGPRARAPEKIKAQVRGFIERARTRRTTIGPVVSDSLIEIPF